MLLTSHRSLIPDGKVIATPPMAISCVRDFDRVSEVNMNRRRSLRQADHTGLKAASERDEVNVLPKVGFY